MTEFVMNPPHFTLIGTDMGYIPTKGSETPPLRSQCFARALKCKTRYICNKKAIWSVDQTNTGSIELQYLRNLYSRVRSSQCTRRSFQRDKGAILEDHITA